MGDARFAREVSSCQLPVAVSSYSHQCSHQLQPQLSVGGAAMQLNKPRDMGLDSLNRNDPSDLLIFASSSIPQNRRFCDQAN